MKNVTKILTAAVLCAALFASDQRIDALGGNAAFWPGDEANIANFPARMLDHGFVQLTGVGLDGDQSARILWNDGGNAWGFGYNNGGTDWFNIDYGMGDLGLGLSIGVINYDNGVDGVWNAANTGINLGVGKSFGWGEIGFSFGSEETTTAATANWTPEVPNTSSWLDTSACSEGGTGNETDGCTNYSDGGTAWTPGSANDSAGEDSTGGGGANDSCTNGGTSASGNFDDCTNEVIANCSDGGADQALCEGDDTADTSDWTESGNCTNDGAGEEGTCTNFAAENGTATSSNSTSDMKINFAREMDLWAFDTILANYSSSDDGTVTATNMGVDFVAHMDAGGAAVVWAMGLDMADCGGDDCASNTLRSTLAVEANMTDWATLRAGVNSDYVLSSDAGSTGQDFAWAWGLGFNWGGLTADYSISDAKFLDPIGTITGQDDGDCDAVGTAADGSWTGGACSAGSLTDQSVTFTYRF